MGGWWRWALVSPDGVARSRMVDLSASVNLPLHRKVQKFSSGTGSPGWSREKGRKTSCLCVCVGTVLSVLCLPLIITSDQSSLTKGRIAAAHGWYSVYFTMGRPFPLKLPLFIGREVDPPSNTCLLYTSPSPRDRTRSRMPSSA